MPKTPASNLNNFLLQNLSILCVTLGKSNAVPRMLVLTEGTWKPMWGVVLISNNFWALPARSLHFHKLLKWFCMWESCSLGNPQSKTSGIFFLARKRKAAKECKLSDISGMRLTPALPSAWAHYKVQGKKAWKSYCWKKKKKPQVNRKIQISLTHRLTFMNSRKPVTWIHYFSLKLIQPMRNNIPKVAFQTSNWLISS